MGDSHSSHSTQSFQINCVSLFNKLPKYQRNKTCDTEDFKIELDKFICQIPDQPIIGNLLLEAVCLTTARQSNSLLARIQET